MQFLLSVIAGIVSSVTVTFLFWLGNKIIFSRYYSDIARVYNSKDKGFYAINKDIKSANEIKILAVRGQSLIDNNILPNLWCSDNSSRKIEIIVSSPENNRTITERSLANNTGADTYKKGIEAILEELCHNKSSVYTNLSVLTHMEDLSFKLFIMSECLYVLYYQKDKNVNKSKFVKYKSNTGAYVAFCHYYESIKGKSDKLI